MKSLQMCLQDDWVYSMKEMNAACGAVEGRSVQRQIAGIGYSLHQMDCLEWMDLRPPNHVHAIVTDPPYGLKEYTGDEKRKLRSRRGGIWRIPPSYDGCQRSPVPRFTVLTEADRAQLRASLCHSPKGLSGFWSRADTYSSPAAHYSRTSSICRLWNPDLRSVAN